MLPITVEDLTIFAAIEPVKAQAMIDDAVAQAALVAPCITSPDFEHIAAARAILRGAILRRNEAGTGALQTQTAGPFSVGLDTRSKPRPFFEDSELADLAALCSAPQKSGARMGWLV